MTATGPILLLKPMYSVYCRLILWLMLCTYYVSVRVVAPISAHVLPSPQHHCRECGRVVCSACSSHEIDLMSMRLGLEPTDGKLERVCDRCFVLLQSVQRKDRGTSVKKVGGPTYRDSRQPCTHSLVCSSFSL